MEAHPEHTELYEELWPIVRGMGYCLVECASKVIQERLQVHLTIYKKEGIGVDDCAAVHKTVMPRLELAQDRKDVYLEVSSPGLDRRIKYGIEFRCFTGETVSIMPEDTLEWETGVLEGYDDGTVRLAVQEETRMIKLETIKKAKLAYVGEVR